MILRFLLFTSFIVSVFFFSSSVMVVIFFLMMGCSLYMIGFSLCMIWGFHLNGWPLLQHECTRSSFGVIDCVYLLCDWVFLLLRLTAFSSVLIAVFLQIIFMQPMVAVAFFMFGFSLSIVYHSGRKRKERSRIHVKTKRSLYFRPRVLATKTTVTFSLPNRLHIR